MRTGILCVIAVFAVALPARAQIGTSTINNPFATAFTGNDPRQIKFTPIDVSKASQAFKMNNMMRTPAPAKAFSFSNLMPKFSMPSWPPKIGVPTLPQGTNPYQPNRPVGVNLFGPKN
jgi:hypothetical protein